MRPLPRHGGFTGSVVMFEYDWTLVKCPASWSSYSSRSPNIWPISCKNRSINCRLLAGGPCVIATIAEYERSVRQLMLECQALAVRDELANDERPAAAQHPWLRWRSRSRLDA